MKEKKYCNIIQDLLPNYIEQLTNEETNNYIEGHLTKCSDCTTIFENMKENLTSSKVQKDQREVKYIKKYNKKMRFLKTFILLILITLILVVVRNLFIILNLQHKTQEYINSTNYRKTIYSYERNNYSKNEISKFGNTTVIKKTELVNGLKTITTIYQTGIKSNIYIEKENQKFVRLNQNTNIYIEISNDIQTDNWIQLVIAALSTFIRKDSCNGKDCYYITNWLGTSTICEDGAYVDSQTGLVIRKPSTTSQLDEIGQYINPMVDYEYEFNTVQEDDLVEPDISQYKVQK